jgi:hypothetical protein
MIHCNETWSVCPFDHCENDYGTEDQISHHTTKDSLIHENKSLEHHAFYRIQGTFSHPIFKKFQNNSNQKCNKLNEVYCTD